MSTANVTDLYQTRTVRYGGALVGVGSLATLPIIALFLASGGPELAGASGESVANVMVASPTGLAWVGILSVPANLMVIIGALMLTHRAPSAKERLPTEALWYGVAVPFVLVMLYDLALPYLLVPLAQSYASNGDVFDALFRTFDFGHTVGLMVTFLFLAGLFWGEAQRQGARLPRVWSLVAVAASVVAIFLTISFLAGSPLVILAPSAFVVWLSLGVLGLRLAVQGP